MMGGLAAWFAGFPDRAGVLSAEAIGLGRTLGDPFSYAMALSFGSSVAMMRREPEIVEERCTATQRLLDDHQLGLGHFGSTAKIVRGWAAAVTGDLIKVANWPRRASLKYDAVASLVFRFS
jgi:hypothetical protein